MNNPIVENAALSPWFDIRKDGPPVRNGVYEGWTNLVSSPNPTFSTRGYKCLWEGGRWKNLPNTDTKMVDISAPPNPDFWRGIVRVDDSSIDTSPPMDAEIPAILLSLPFLCLNCDTPIRDASVFCSELCKDEAKFVRYFRACRHDGRLDRPDVQEALRIRLAFILGGGYAERDRRLPSSVREAVFARDEGKCRACGMPGNQIDHISGSSGDLRNLQLLCSKCHNKKTTANFKRITTETHPEALAKRDALFARAKAREAVRFCDREDWEKTRRQLERARRETLGDGGQVAAIGVGNPRTLTRAKSSTPRSR
jgi:5-methylcytosine-specific restriction endonuclease McrA